MTDQRIPIAAAFQSACLDCPAARKDAFAGLVGVERGECAFHNISVEARDPVPQRWFEDYGVGLVRRGILIRQRLDRQGRTFAIDAVGPGSVFPLRDRRGPSASTGYAASRLLVCLVPDAQLTSALDSQLEAGQDLVRLQGEAIERLERITEARGRRSAAAQVATLLCALADTVTTEQRQDVIPGGLQQRDIAALLGIRHETVCRVLKQLEEQSLVGRDDDGNTHIDDRVALESL